MANEKFGAETGYNGVGANLVDNAASNSQDIFTINSNGKYISGARTIIRINGKIAAFAFGVSWRINTSQDEVNTIDDWTPYEYAPKRITVEGTISGFHIPGQGIAKQLIMPNALSFMFHKYITIEVKDRTTDNLLFLTNKAVITGLSEDIKANEIGTMSLTWKAIGWGDDMPADQMAPSPLEAELSGKTSVTGKALGAFKKLWS